MATYNRKPRFKKARFVRRKRKTGFLRKTGPGTTMSAPLGRTLKSSTRYVTTQLSILPSVGTPQTHVFSLNGLFDPDITGVGHQPLGFDQLMTMYDHYTVIGARARVTFSNTDGANANTCVLHTRDSITPTNDISRIIENGRSRWCVLSPESAGGNTKTLSLNCSPSKFFGRKIMQGDKYQGNSSSNPADGVFLHITVGPADIVSSNKVVMTVVIEYVVIYTEPKMLAQS